MINGLGVLGWGVGGIEAEAVMLGQPYFMLVPQVVGVRLAGKAGAASHRHRPGAHRHRASARGGVVGRFVEYFGPGAEGLTVADRATVANMAPEYGATCGFFPVDGETVAYLRQTGRPDELCARVEAYCRSQGLFRGAGFPRTGVLLGGGTRPGGGAAQPGRSAAAPRPGAARRHGQEIPPGSAHPFQGREDVAKAKVELEGRREVVRDGDVVIASITSCTNTSNPALMLAAGLLARKAVELGLAPKPWVRTSMAPGSRAVTGYLAEAGLLEPLESPGLRDGGLRMRHLHRQQRAACPRTWSGPSGTRTWWWRPC